MITKDQVDKLKAGRDECWSDLLALKNHYNDLCNKAVELGLKFEDIDPDAIKLVSKICMTEMRINYSDISVSTENIVPKLPK